MTDETPENEPEDERRSSADRRKGDRRAVGMETREINDGQYVFREHETANQAFIVTAGSIEIVKSKGGKDVRLGVAGVGGIFGEMALFDNQPRMASARAVGGKAEIMVVSRKMLDRKLAAVDPFTRALIDILADHIRSLASALSKAETRAS